MSPVKPLDRTANVVRFFALLGGLPLILIGLAADAIGLSHSPGIGPDQALLILAGGLGVAAAAFARQLVLLGGKVAPVLAAVQRVPVLNRVLPLLWAGFWIWVLWAGSDYLGRRILGDKGISLVSRSYHPYLTHGAFDGDQARLGPEGPGSYGYKELRSAYVFPFDRPVKSISERGEFLFQDRVAEANNEPSTKALRVFVLGASVVYANDASTPEHRWFVQLEKMLTRELRREVKLIPAAIGAYVTTQERLALDLMVLPRKPDAVILLDGFNDVALPITAGTRPGDPYSQGLIYKQHYSPSFSFQKWLSANHSIYRFLSNVSLYSTMERTRQKLLQDPATYANCEESITGVYFDNVRWMLERCRERGIPAAAFLQPARVLTEHRQGQPEPSASLDKLTLKLYQALEKKSKDLPSEVRFHSLTDMFDTPPPGKLWTDACHFLDPGQERLAQRMTAPVRDLLLTKYKPGS